MKRFLKKITRVKKCPLCEQAIIVDYKEIVVLKKYISERGKIQSRSRTGICAKHQRQVTKNIKRARYIALMPFAQS